MLLKKSKRIVYLVLFFLLINLTGVKAQQPEQRQGTPTQVEITPEPAIIGESKPYTLGKEDVLQITVQNHPEFSGQFVIGPDGKIQYSFVGDIETEGLTKEQMREILVKKLDRFMKAPEISVAIVAYRSKNIYILGEVTRPGKYTMKGDMISLRDAIVEAGLPTPNAALRKVYIIKSDPVKPTYKKVNLFKILYKGKTKDNVDLVPDDIVFVPSTVSSKINRTLGNLLSPLFQAAFIKDLFNLE